MKMVIAFIKKNIFDDLLLALHKIVLHRVQKDLTYHFSSAFADNPFPVKSSTGVSQPL